MFNILKTKLPRVINKVVVVIGLCGMFVGLLLSVQNQQGLAWSLFYSSLLGLAFAAAAKYLVVNFMRAWMEGKLEQVSREKEEMRRRAEQLKIDEKTPPAKAPTAAAVPVDPKKPA